MHINTGRILTWCRSYDMTLPLQWWRSSSAWPSSSNLVGWQVAIVVIWNTESLLLQRVSCLQLERNHCSDQVYINVFYCVTNCHHRQMGWSRPKERLATVSKPTPPESFLIADWEKHCSDHFFISVFYCITNCHHRQIRWSQQKTDWPLSRSLHLQRVSWLKLTEAGWERSLLWSSSN